ncbi:monocarboxylate permease [Daedaleopsis nitida]|nr:monocarboxylate permease [Daedaleopsis nitida]
MFERKPELQNCPEKRRDEVTHVDSDADPQLEFVPDGGREAWTVCLGCSLALFASAGMTTAYGTFQDYYQTSLLPSSSSSSISLIGSLQICLLYSLGTVAGRVFDAYGTTIIIPLGSVISVFSMMMVSLAQKDQAYQLFLAQGLLFGIGLALLFSPSIALLGHWFRRRRALVIGLATGGSATGGVVFPIILETLIPKIGFPWAVRVVAFVIMGCLTVSCLTMRTRLPLSGHISLRTAVNLGGWKDPRYVLATIGGFLLFYALFIPYFYIQTYASFRGVDPRIGNYLLAIMNAMNVLSRILPGFMADRFGTQDSLTVFVPSAGICGALVLGVWLPSRNTASITAFAVFYGLFSGAYVSLLPTYIATISPREVYGARLGSVYLVIGIATLVGTPTGGAFLKEIDDKHFTSLIIFTGVITLVGTLVLGSAGLVDSQSLRRFLRTPGPGHALASYDRDRTSDLTA